MNEEMTTTGVSATQNSHIYYFIVIALLWHTFVSKCCHLRLVLFHRLRIVRPSQVVHHMHGLLYGSGQLGEETPYQH